MHLLMNVIVIVITGDFKHSLNFSLTSSGLAEPLMPLADSLGSVECWLKITALHGQEHCHC